MAFTAATIPAFRVAKTTSGNAPQAGHYTVAAGATFKRGDPVALNATDDQITGLVDAATAMLGIAGDDAVPTDGRATNIGLKILVYEASPDTIFSANYVSGITADIAVGDGIGINLTTTVYTVDIAKADLFVTRGLDATDGGQRVLVSVLPAGNQSAGGSALAA